MGMARVGKGMRISELARRTETSRETIHFYLREGLLARPAKTSRNMAYYDEGHVQQLLLIRRLRTESYLPLAAIKKVLAEGGLGAPARRLDLAGELFGQGARTDLEPLDAATLAARAGISEARLARYQAAGLLCPEGPPEAPRYGHADLKAAQLLAQAEAEAGPGAEALVLERFALLERHMRALVDEEVAHFFARVVTEGEPTKVLEVLRGSREVISRYLALARGRHLVRQVDAMLPALEQSRGPREPLYLPALPDDPERGAEAQVRAARVAALAAAPGDLQRQVDLLEHLLWVGDAQAALDAAEGASSAAPLRLARGEALLMLERWDEAFQELGDPRGAEVGPWGEALWGAAVLIRIRERFRQLDSSQELVGLLARAFGAFEAARAAPAPPAVRLRILLLIGRIGAGAPDFLRARPQARRDLEAAQEILRSAPGLELPPTARGRIERNLTYFLAQC
jgi:DNA-binding transcriptional MerR regulator